MDLKNSIFQAIESVVNYLAANPREMSIGNNEYSHMSPEQRRLFLEGEALYFVSREISSASSQRLFASQWGFSAPEWFDHRHSWLDPDKWNHDYVDSSVYNVLPRLPLDGSMLSLCCGDGFFEKHYYSKRCSSIIAVDKDESALAYANRLHSAPNISYCNSDIFGLNFPDNSFDVIVMRSAIEHFTEEQQRFLFSLIKRWLKPVGWFIGDTPANPDHDDTHKLLQHHEHEWSSESGMRRDLSKCFTEVITSVLISNEPTANGPRTTLFWACR